MKRDMDLIRDILLRVEEKGDPTETETVSLDFDGRDEAVVKQHAKLLYEAGYIKAHYAEFANSFVIMVVGLTWAGHDFLEATRSQMIWNSVKERAKEFGGSMSLDLAKALALKLAAVKLGLE